jgi:hypothetical protein
MELHRFNYERNYPAPAVVPPKDNFNKIKPNGLRWRLGGLARLPCYYGTKLRKECSIFAHV